MNILEPGRHSQAQAAANADVAYYRKRALQEQVAAQRAGCPTARSIHDELAALYRFRVSILTDDASEMGITIALQRLSAQMRADQLPVIRKESIVAGAPVTIPPLTAGGFRLAS